MKARLFLFLLLPWLAITNSFADSEALADANDPASLWMTYCSSFLPCKMVTVQSDAKSAGASLVDKVKNYFSRFGSPPVMTSSEFKEYLATLSSTERKGFVKRCIQHRGEPGREICENDYLLDDELKAINERKRIQTSKSRFEQLKDERERLVREDDRLHYELIKNCNEPALRCSVYSADSFTSDILRLKRGIDKLNQNPEFKENFSSLDSKAIAWTKVTQEITDSSIIPKAPERPQKNWRDLPIRNNDDNPIAINVNNKSDFKDPYSGVSNQLSQEKIDEKAGSWQLVTETLLGVAEAVAINQIHNISKAENAAGNSVRQGPQSPPHTNNTNPATTFPPVTTSSVNPYANSSLTAASSNLTGCLSVTTHSQGKYCGDPTSYAVTVTNTCNAIMAAEICIKRLDGTGNCGRNSDLHPGQSQNFYSCEATNVFKYLGCEHYTKSKHQPSCSIMQHNAVWQD